MALVNGPSASRGGPETWTTGRCWLYCRRDGVRVRRLGPVRSRRGDVVLYACADCVAELDGLVAEELRREAACPPPAPDGGPVPARLCMHPELQKRDGKTFCRRCGRQIYL
jgi:hypothetical protein